LLPGTIPLHLEAWDVDERTSNIILHITSTSPQVPCPGCARVTRRVHSRYARTLADLPWGTWRVTWQLHGRKFFCDNPVCGRRIFTERLPGGAVPWARPTMRYAARLTALGLALGGAAGVPLSQQLSVPVSRQTLLRAVRRLPVPSRETPTVLGVDDFAFRKRQTYGTVLIDLERRQPIALLPDREAETLAHWLQTHPGGKVSTRERSKAYADGARQGAPTATQVADRFHLLQNLVEALTQVFNLQGQALKAVHDASSRTPRTRPEGTVGVPVPPAAPSHKALGQAAHSRSRRVARHEQIWAWRRQGWTGRAMARQLQMAKGTVFRYLRSPTFAERTYQRRGHSILNPYKDTILEHWNRGCHAALQLFHVLQQQGYRGS
jgi:transposase